MSTLRPAELLAPAVLPDPGAVVERPEAVGVLLEDQHDGVLLEAERHVEPPHALEGRVGGRTLRLGLPHRPDPPRAVARADPSVGSDRDVGPVDRDGALPGADLREALGVEGDPRPGAHHVRLLLHDVEGPFPGQVERDALGLLERDPQAAQRFDHLEAVAADVLVEPVVVHRVREVYGGLLIAPADQHEGVLRAEVRVVAQAGDQEDLAAPVVGVEVAPVVEVAVAGACPRDRQRHLVEGVLVETADHQPVTPRPRPAAGRAAACGGTASRCRRGARSHRSGSAVRRCA